MIGTPIVDSHSRFVKTATYGDQLAFEVSIPEWRGKSFVQRYRCMRGADLIMECDEVRIFAGRRAEDPEAIRALPIPEEIKKLCE